MRSASANVNHSVLRQSGKNTVVQPSRCCPFTRQKKKKSDPCLISASPVRERPERHESNITSIFFGMKRINRKRVAKLTVYYTCVNVFSIYLLLFVYRCVIFFKTSPVLGEGLI